MSQDYQGTEGDQGDGPPPPLVDGVPTLKDLELLYLLERSKGERLFPLVMYNTDPEISPSAFLHSIRVA
jgi:hypothetical protein